MLQHILPFYLLANLIIACGYEGQPEKWGSLNPKSGNLWAGVMRDCDFYTFIPKLRPLLDPEIFMKDLDKTRELLKNCFEYFYLYYFLWVKSGGYPYRTLADDIEMEVRLLFDLKGYDFIG